MPPKKHGSADVSAIPLLISSVMMGARVPSPEDEGDEDEDAFEDAFDLSMGHIGGWFSKKSSGSSGSSKKSGGFLSGLRSYGSKALKNLKWAGGKMADGASALKNNAKWAGGKMVDGAKWTGGKMAAGAGALKDGAMWAGGKMAAGAGLLKDGAAWAGGKIATGIDKTMYVARQMGKGVYTGLERAGNIYEKTKNGAIRKLAKAGNIAKGAADSVYGFTSAAAGAGRALVKGAHGLVVRKHSDQQQVEQPHDEQFEMMNTMGAAMPASSTNVAPGDTSKHTGDNLMNLLTSDVHGVNVKTEDDVKNSIEHVEQTGTIPPKSDETQGIQPLLPKKTLKDKLSKAVTALLGKKRQEASDIVAQTGGLMQKVASAEEQLKKAQAELYERNKQAELEQNQAKQDMLQSQKEALDAREEALNARRDALDAQEQNQNAQELTRQAQQNALEAQQAARTAKETQANLAALQKETEEQEKDTEEKEKEIEEKKKELQQALDELRSMHRQLRKHHVAEETPAVEVDHHDQVTPYRQHDGLVTRNAVAQGGRLDDPEGVISTVVQNWEEDQAHMDARTDQNNKLDKEQHVNMGTAENHVPIQSKCFTKEQIMQKATELVYKKRRQFEDEREAHDAHMRFVHEDHGHWEAEPPHPSGPNHPDEPTERQIVRAVGSFTHNNPSTPTGKTPADNEEEEEEDAHEHDPRDPHSAPKPLASHATTPVLRIQDGATGRTYAADAHGILMPAAEEVCDIGEEQVQRAAKEHHPLTTLRVVGVSNHLSDEVLKSAANLDPYDKYKQQSDGTVTTSSGNAIKSLFEIGNYVKKQARNEVEIAALAFHSLFTTPRTFFRVAHSHHLGGTCATLLRVDGEPLDRAQTVSHISIEGNCRNNTICAETYSHDAFLHPQLNCAQHVLMRLSETALHHYMRDSLDPAVRNALLWTIQHLILDSMKPSIAIM